jgi:hypothetical protein
MTNGCGFCRDFRLFFKLLHKHLNNFIIEFNEYRYVCDVAQVIKPPTPFTVTKKVQDVRDLAAERFRGVDDSLTVTPDKISDPTEDWIMGEDGKTIYIVPKT